MVFNSEVSGVVSRTLGGGNGGRAGNKACDDVGDSGSTRFSYRGSRSPSTTINCGGRCWWRLMSVASWTARRQRA